jgi:hypothetical protein
MLRRVAAAAAAAALLLAHAARAQARRLVARASPCDARALTALAPPQVTGVVRGVVVGNPLLNLYGSVASGLGALSYFPGFYAFGLGFCSSGGPVLPGAPQHGSGVCDPTLIRAMRCRRVPDGRAIRRIRRCGRPERPVWQLFRLLQHASAGVRQRCVLAVLQVPLELYGVRR